MKSDKLFDLLGEIDDKFYEEARIPDEQYGIEIVSEHRPFGSFMSIFGPIAACAALIAVVIVGANFINRNAGLVNANESDSDSSFDVTLSSDSGVSSESSAATSTESSTSSVPDVSNDIELLTETELLENYPPIDLDSVPDIKGNGLEVQMTQQDKTLQKATLGTFKRGEYGKYTLYMLGEYIHIDKSDDPDCLYAYYVTLALVKDGKVIDSDSTHTTSVSMGQGGYRFSVDELKSMADGQISYLLYADLCDSNIVIFRYILPKDGSYERDNECTFYTITDSGELRLLMGDTSGIGGSVMTASVFLYDGYILDSGQDTITDKDVRYKFISKNFGSNPYDGAPHFTASEYVNPDDVLDLSEYPPVDISQIPDVGEKVYNPGIELPKATIAEKQVGEYTLSLIGDGLRTSSVLQRTDDARFMAENVRSVISRDGNVINVTHEYGTLEGETYFDTGEETSADKQFHDTYNLTELLPDAYEMSDGIVFSLNRKSRQQSSIYKFGTIKNDVMEEFAVPEDITSILSSYESTGEVTVTSEENAVFIDGVGTYIFDFDALTYSFTAAKYTTFDSEAFGKVQPHVILDIKQDGEYKYCLMGDNVTINPAEEFPIVEFETLFIAVEKDGKRIARVNADNYSPLNGSKLSDYIQLFEMKDGKGFIMYYDLDPYGNQYEYAKIYKLENDVIFKQYYVNDNAPASAEGSPYYIGHDFTIDYDNNAIIVGDKKVTIDFDINMFHETEREI